MTPELYDKLTNEARERKVLELWGWKNLHYNDHATCDMSEVGLTFRGDLGVHHDIACPDVLTDTNAIHEAMQTIIDPVVQKRFLLTVYNIMDGHNIQLAQWNWKMLFLPAALLSKAFVLALEPA